MPDDASAGYRLQRAAMCYDAGRLQSVRYGIDPDAPACVWAVLLEFEFTTWMLDVISDDDTVRIRRYEELEASDLSFEPVPVESPWTPALGISASWVWAMENQQGYCDGLQFAFARDGAEACRVQLIAAASSWQINGWSL